MVEAGLDLGNVRQIAALFRNIHAITNEPGLGNLETGVSDRHVDQLLVRIDQERT